MKLMRARALIAGLVLFCLATNVVAQTWQAERKRLEAEFVRIVDKVREDGASDLSEVEAEISQLHAEYLQKVIKPALSQARTCRQRMDAVELAISLERQAQILGTSILDDQEIADLVTGTYANSMYERCMNELYRTCVLEDNPMYTLTMSSWAIGWERQKQLLGASETSPLDMKSELDPRITKCRGPWYKVRIAVERSGVEPELGPWHDRDISEGWMGRGLGRTPSRSSQSVSLPGDFERRAEQLGHGAVCPDGGCGGSCSFLAVAEGRARVEYELEASHAFRMLHIGFIDDEENEKLEKNECPHEDLPISFYPGLGFDVQFPADLVTPLTDDPKFPGGADPKVTEAFDEWPRMFGAKGVELEVWGEPIGRLDVQQVCDGQEIWGRGSAECQQKWQEYLKVFSDQTPLPPWERKSRNR